MTQIKIYLSFILWASLLFGFLPNEEITYSSPEHLVANQKGNLVFVCESTARRIAIVDINKKDIQSHINLPAAPNGITLAHNDSLLIVAAGSNDGKVFFIRTANGLIESTVPVGHTPCSPVITPDGSKLFILNRYSNAASVIDIKSKRVIAHIDVAREPCAADLTPDGTLLVIAHHLPAESALNGYAAANVTLLDATLNKVIKELPLPNGSTGVQDICVSPDGRYVYTTHVLARYNVPTNQIERGWINTNALSIIDIKKRKLLNTVLLDDLDRGAANPWGVACSEDGSLLCVSHAGTHELSIIDRIALHEKVEKVHNGEWVSDACKNAKDIPNDLTFLADIRKRLPLNGNGPRGIIFSGDNVIATEYFSASLAIHHLKSTDSQLNDTVQLAEESISEVRHGELLFHDASWCLQGWQSCASCHPGAGRVDALNWDLLNDGIGNPKNSKSLLFSHQTPPVMISGVRDRAETAVRAGIKYILFTEADEHSAKAVDRYIKSLKPLKSPLLHQGSLSESAQKGKIVFLKAGCADCHKGPYFTDLKKYNVGTGTGRERDQEFDTPTLIEIWRTGPYLYDGRAGTIREVLGKYNSTDLHGSTSRLSQQEIDDLAEYILSL